MGVYGNWGNCFLPQPYKCISNAGKGENEFDLHENEPVGGTHFHMTGFALRLVLIQRQTAKGNSEMAHYSDVRC